MDLQYNISNSSDFNTSQEDNAASSDRKDMKTMLVVALGLSWINAVLMVSLNIAVIVAIATYKKKSKLYFLLLNLAIADLLTGLLDTFPHSVERSIGLYYQSFNTVWPLGNEMCKIQRTVVNVTLMASNYILAATSIDRVLVICSPMTSMRRGRIVQKVLIVACWGFSAVLSCPLLFIVSTTTLTNHPSLETCHLDLGQDRAKNMKIFINLFFLFIFALPFLIIVISYCILVVFIFRRASTSRNSIQGYKGQASFTQVFNKGLPKSKVKSIKLTFGIVLSFIISWGGFFGVMYRQIYTDDKFRLSDMLLITCYYWNSIANPILFFIFHKRRTAKRSTSGFFYSSETERLSVTAEGRSLHNIQEHSTLA